MEHAYHQAADPFPPSQTPMALSPSHQPLEPWRHQSTLAMQMSGQLFSVLPMLPRPHFRHLTVSKSAAPPPLPFLETERRRASPARQVSPRPRRLPPRPLPDCGFTRAALQSTAFRDFSRLQPASLNPPSPALTTKFL